MSDVAAPAAPASPVAAASPAAPAASAPVEAKSADPKAPVAADPGAVPGEQMVKLIIEGVEEEVPLREALRLAQMGKASHKKWQEAAELRKEAHAEKARVAEFIDSVKKDPRAFFSDPRIGLDAKAFAKQMITEQLEAELAAEAEANMAPEEKEVRDMRRELERYRTQEQETKTAKEKAEKDADEAKYQADVKADNDRLGQTILAAVQHLGFPAGDEALAVATEMANILEVAVASGVEISAEDLAAEWTEAAKVKFNKAVRASKRVDLIDPEVADLLRKQAVADYLKNPHPTTGKGSVSKDKDTKKPEKPERRFSSSIARDFMLGH